jgi:TonB family protein
MAIPRNFAISFCLLILISVFSGYCYAEDEIVIHSYLMRGFGKTSSVFGLDSSTASLSKPLLLHIPAENGEPGENAFAILRDDVSSIYQFSSIMDLTSASMTWDGKAENLNEAILAATHLYPIQFYPRSVKGNTLSLRVEGFRCRYGEIRYLQDRVRFKREITYGDFDLFTDTRKLEDGVGGEKWLNTEMALPLGGFVVFALPGEDQSYFLAIRAYKKDARQFSAGLTGTKLEYFNVSDADPVCGRIVGRGDGIEKVNRAETSWTYKNYTFIFCSQACLEKFQKDPEACLKKSKIKYFDLVASTKNPSYSEIHKIPQETDESIKSSPLILVRPALPESCKEKNLGGVLKAKVQVDPAGDVTNVHVLNSLNPELDDAAITALRQWKYGPLPKEILKAPLAFYIDLDFKPGQRQLAVESNAIVENRSDLDPILNEAADYCHRLEEAALNFVCLERIKETIYAGKHLASVLLRRREPQHRKYSPDGMQALLHGNLGERNDYIYDYQLIRKEGRLVERRILTKANEPFMTEGSSFQELKRIYFYKPILGPIGLLSRDSQPEYHYSLSKEELVDGREALVLDAKPIKVVPGRANYGKLWVDKQDGTVLKMEIEAESLEGYERIQGDYINRGVKPILSIEILFGFENKGLRYPSRILIKEAYSFPGEGRVKVSQITVDYDHYRFFSVETGTQIKDK